MNKTLLKQSHNEQDSYQGCRAAPRHRERATVENWDCGSQFALLWWRGVSQYKDGDATEDMSHSQMLGKFEYGGGPIFKVVLEC